MKRIKTLRVRFALWVTLLVVGAFVVFGAFVYFSLARDLAATLDTALQLSAAQLLAAVNYENGQINVADSLPEDSAAADLSARGVTFRILDAQGNVIGGLGAYQALPRSDQALAAARRGESVYTTVTNSAGNDSLRLYSAPIIENGQPVGALQVAQSLANIQATLAQLLRALLVGGVGLIALAAGGGYWLAARALAPIDRITQTARKISVRDLAARLNLPATDDEVGHLAATFDLMLARLDEAWQRERRFVADASHDLRTPLAAMQAILEVTRHQPRSAPEYERALDDLAAETVRLQALTENLLQLARGDARANSARARVDLSLLLTDVCDALRPRAQAKNLTFRCEIAPRLELDGDSDELTRLFVNLTENAIKYTERGAVTVSARANGKWARIQIQDTGCGIAPQALPHIFERFYRADASRSTEGAGLGLAIAREIALAHDGEISAHSVVGKGSTFIVSLPRVQAGI